MRKIKAIPRIIKIIARRGFKVYCAFNNGEYRIIDFKILFEKWNFKSSAFKSKLLNPEVFNNVKLHEGTLQWPKLTKKMKLLNGESIEIAFDLDPIVLYDESLPDEKRNQRYKIGHLIRKTREENGLTQEELAVKSGTTKNYISRIENNKSDIEMSTFIKIIELGLNQKLDFVIK